MGKSKKGKIIAISIIFIIIAILFSQFGLLNNNVYAKDETLPTTIMVFRRTTDFIESTDGAKYFKVEIGLVGDVQVKSWEYNLSFDTTKLELARPSNGAKATSVNRLTVPFVEDDDNGFYAEDYYNLQSVSSLADGYVRSVVIGNEDIPNPSDWGDLSNTIYPEGYIPIQTLAFRILDNTITEEDLTTDLLCFESTNASLTGWKIGYVDNQNSSESTVFTSDESLSSFTGFTESSAYGTIKGSVTTLNFEGIHKANIRVYKKGTINWNNLSKYDNLEQIKTIENIVTNDDGTYEIQLAPGKYDILIDKAGYLDHIITDIKIKEGTEIVLDNKDLVAGDVNKDGCIDIEDLIIVNEVYGFVDGNSDYTISADFNNDGMIEYEDLTVVNENYDQIRKIINYLNI